MVEAPAEVPESEAEGKVKATYDDVKATLRLPYVPDLIRALAVYPNYLQLAWMALKPNTQIVYFERQSDVLRQTAADLVSRFPHAQLGDQSLAPAIRTIWYAAPKEVLVASALRSATNGQQPRLRALDPDDKRRMAPGVPEGAVAPTRSADPADADTEAVLRDIEGMSHGWLPVEYAALATSPTTLVGVWKTLRAAAQDLEYRRIQRVIASTVEEAVTAFPFRMDINPHVLRHGGLSESDIDGVRAVLGKFDRLARQSLLNAAILAGSDGASPFPAPAA